MIQKLALLSFIILMIIMTPLHALEIDEKLTIRFLKVSNSKKTILLNRGAEDGLNVGDHAKFFVTSGVIARGMVEKLSPSRSVWSLYRIVDPNEIADGKVLNLKIATPLKLTSDASKSLKEEAVSGSSGGADAKKTGDNETSDNSNMTNTSNEDQELADMGLEDGEKNAKKESKTSTSASTKNTTKTGIMNPREEAQGGTVNDSKKWEIWGSLYMNSLSGTTEDSSAKTTATSSTEKINSSIDFSIGLERYFFNANNPGGFFKNISLTLFAHKRIMESSFQNKISTDWLEFGGGLNYHFYNSPADINKLIGFGAINGGVGSANISETNLVSGVAMDTSAKGTSTFFAAGLGAKYILSNGFGLRSVVDYYNSNESDDFGDELIKTSTLSGVRLLVGVSYRF